MKVEELLKSISSLIKKNERFLIGSPEIFKAIETRLHKAINYEDYQGEKDQDDSDYYGEEKDESGINEMFDQHPDDKEEADQNENGEVDGDEAEKWLKENTPQEDEEELPQERPQPKRSSSVHREWSPQDNYEDDHQEAINQHLEDGYSHREAERFAGATPFLSSDQAFNSKVKMSSGPSDKFWEEHGEGIREQAKEWLYNAEIHNNNNAEAHKNPINHATGRTHAINEAIHGDFDEAYSNFFNSDELSELRGRARNKAIQEFKQKYHEDNPEYKEQSIQSADAGKIFGEAMDTRAKHIESEKDALINAHKSDGGTLTGDFSHGASQAGDLTGSGKAQMAGASQEESGYSVGVEFDPYAHFAQNNPEYIKHLKEQKGIKEKKIEAAKVETQNRQKLETDLSHPDHVKVNDRHTALKAFKGEE